MAKSLSGWEADWRTRIPHVELLGELDLTVEIRDELAALIAQKVQSHTGSGDVLKVLESHYPTTLAIYLVAEGIYGYRGGAYWPQVHRKSELPQTTSRLGQFFEKFLEEHSLPLFTELEGLRYISRILLHGGIPDYCLPDFFAHLLYPSLARPDLLSLDGAEVIAEWLHQSGRHATDEPVKRFLQFGGPLAHDFATRCLALARRYEESRRIPPAHEVGLPIRIVAQYERWVQSHPPRPAPRQSALALRRPRLLLDPWQGEGIDVELPAQQLTGDLPAAGGQWRVVSGSTILQAPLYPQRRAGQWETEATWLCLPLPARECTISLIWGGETQQRWRIPLLSPSIPLLAFEPLSGRLLPAASTLPARPLWLLYPAREKLTVVGGQFEERFDPLPGEWGNFKIEQWDLTRAEQVEVGEQHWPIQFDSQALRPSLAGGELLADVVGEGEIPLYAGQPPDIVIPLPPHRRAEQEMERWQLHLYESGTGRSLYKGPLTSLATLLQTEANTLRLPLVDQTLLGAQPFGTFHLQLRGPLGRDQHFTFAMVPRLRLRGHEQLRLVGLAGSLPEAHVLMHASERVQVTSPDPGVLVQVGQVGLIHIHTPAEATTVTLHLAKPRSQSAPVALKIPLPVLRWRVAADEMSEWSVKPLAYPLAVMEQATSFQIHVRVDPHGPNRLDGELQVVYGRHHPPQRLRARGRAQTFLSFDLREAADSLRASDEASCTCHLVLRNLPGREAEVRLPVLHLTRSLALDSFALEQCVVDEQWLIEAQWQTQQPLREQVLRLWPLWAPWREPLTLPLPDEATSPHLWQLPLASLPPGDYRAELTVQYGWSSAPPLRPLRPSANTTDISLGDTVVQADALRALPTDGEGWLTHLLASADEPSAHRALQRFEAIFRPEQEHIEPALLTLLALLHHPRFGAAIEQQSSSLLPPLRALLLEAPLALLSVLAQRILRGQEAWEVWLEVLWLISPPLARFLDEGKRSGFVTRSALYQWDVFQASEETSQAEIESLLHDLGIMVESHTPSARFARPYTLLRDVPNEWLDNPLSIYLHEMGQFPLLDAQGEQALTARFQEGRQALLDLCDLPNLEGVHAALLHDRIDRGKEAREQMILSNLRLVVSIAKRHQGQGLHLADLVQEGNVGLMRAIERFDHTRGYKFSTYATWWIRQSISRAVADQARTIRVPVHMVDVLNRLSRTIRYLEQELGREPTVEEIALDMGVGLTEDELDIIRATWRGERMMDPAVSQRLKRAAAKVLRLINLLEEPLSLETSMGGGGGSLLGDFIPDSAPQPDEIAIHELFRTELLGLLEQLNPRERQICILRFGLRDGQSQTLEEIGQKFGVTRERIRQIEAKALKKLRHPLRSKQLRDYLR